MKNGNAASRIKDVKSDATMELNKLMISHSKLKNFHFHPEESPITFLITITLTAGITLTALLET